MSELAVPDSASALLERVVIGGDLSKLSAAERVSYYQQVCSSVGLNPLTKPFQYILLQGKLTLYATKDATEQLRRRDQISIRIVGREMHESVGAYVVTAQASTASGRTDEATGAVSIKGLTGEALANAIMKAETKAKRRVTLSICGLGFLDESEVSSIPGADEVPIDLETGEIAPVPVPEPPASSTAPEVVPGPPLLMPSPLAKHKDEEVSSAVAKKRLVEMFQQEGEDAENAKVLARNAWLTTFDAHAKTVPRAALEELIAELKETLQPIREVFKPNAEQA